MSLTDLYVLITGGTGSFGKKFTEVELETCRPRKLIVFSRDELKQFEMRERFSDNQYDCIRYFLCDVRDRDRLYRALAEWDVVGPAATMKQVAAAEYDRL